MRQSKAQSILELTILIICIVAALLTISVYIKRAFQGRLRNVSEEISTRKYFPGKTLSYIKEEFQQNKIVNNTYVPLSNLSIPPVKLGEKLYDGKVMLKEEVILNELNNKIYDEETSE